MNTSEGLARLRGLGGEFHESAERLAKEWVPESPPITALMYEFGRVIANAARSERVEIVRDSMLLVEQLMKDGDQDLKDAVATGLLECLLAEASAGKLNFAVIVPYLGKHSRAYCRAWDSFTGVKTAGL